MLKSLVCTLINNWLMLQLCVVAVKYHGNRHTDEKYPHQRVSRKHNDHFLSDTCVIVTWCVQARFRWRRVTKSVGLRPRHGPTARKGPVTIMHHCVSRYSCFGNQLVRLAHTRHVVRDQINMWTFRRARVRERVARDERYATTRLNVIAQAEGWAHAGDGLNLDRRLVTYFRLF